MPDIHIERSHALGLTRARELADEWMTDARERLSMDCSCERGETEDRIVFSRTGASGSLRVTGDVFALDARLGFLLGSFKDRIEQEIGKNLDALLGAKTP